MAVAALVVAIISALGTAGTLWFYVASFRRSGWDLKVEAYWDRHDHQVHVEITNVGRQACVVSEIRYFISAVVDAPHQGDEAVFFDYDAEQPIAASATIEITKRLDLPAAFTLEVWAWTGGRPYKSSKWIQDTQAGHAIER